MPRIAPIQTSFAGGEISSRMQGKVDSDLYKAALELCREWRVTPQGSLLMRGGTRMVENVGQDPYARGIPMRMGNGQDYMMVLTDHLWSLWSLVGGVPIPVNIAGLSFITNGDFSADDASWTSDTQFPSYVSFGAGDLKMHSETAAYEGTDCKVYQDFTPAQATAATLQLKWKKAAGWLGYVYTRIYRGTDPLTRTTLLQKQYRPDEMTMEALVNLEAAQEYRLEISFHCHTRYRHNYWANAFLDWVKLTADVMGTQLTHYAPWSGPQLADLQFVSEPGVNRTFFVSPDVAPWSLEYDEVNNTWLFQPCSFIFTGGDTTIPDAWALAQPDVAEIYQGRLLLARGNTIWASRSGSLLDFTTETVPAGGGDAAPLSSDAIVAPIATKGRIRWLHGRQSLLGGTDIGEISIRAQGGVLTPSDFQVRQESAFGSAPRQSIDLGNEVLYLSRDRRKVRMLDFQNEAQAWTSQDLTFVAEHFTRPLIREMHFARDPDDTVVLVLDDGTAACCTYNPGAKVAAWWGFDLGDPIISAAVVDGPAGSVLYLLVKRATGLLLELMPMSEFSDLQVYLDSAVVVQSPPGPIISGLGHLEGRTVGVIVDGWVQPDQVVVGGEITLPREGDLVTVGLRYRAQAQRLRPEGGNPGGTAQVAARRFSRVVLRLSESALPLVNGERGRERSTDTPLDTPPPPFTGDSGVWPRSPDPDARILIEQDMPLRTEVLAIFGLEQVDTL